MKAFLQMFRLRELQKNFSHAFSRFPLAVLISAGITILIFSLIGNWFPNISEELIGKYILTGIIVFFLSISSSIAVSSYERSRFPKTISSTASIIFGALFFYFLDINIEAFENVIFFSITFIGIVSFLFFAPYTKFIGKKDIDAPAFYVYFYKIAVVFLFSFILGGLLAILGNIAIATVRTLFDITYGITDDIHGYWTTFALSFFTPIFALTQIPKQEDSFSSYFNENKFFNFLVRYIAVPFVFIYFIILYAYSIKVLSNFSSWPKGEVSWMVIGFSFFGYLAYIFSYIFESSSKNISKNSILIFRKYFPYVVIPQIAMLFYAIGLRIGQYDLTINRYLVVVFGIWLAVISLYYIFSRKKYLLYIPAILTLFTIIVSIGPWSVYHLPYERQLKRLESNLIKANILQDGVILPLENYSDIDEKLSGNIASGINYVCDFKECESLKTLFPEVVKKLEEKNLSDFQKNKKRHPEIYKEKDVPEISKWMLKSEIRKYLKVREYYFGANIEKTILNLSTASEDIYPLQTTGVDFIDTIDTYNLSSNYIDLEKQVMYYNDESFDLGDVFSTLQKESSTNDFHEMTKEDMTFNLENEKYGIQIIIRNIYLVDNENIKNNYYGNMSGILLVKEK